MQFREQRAHAQRVSLQVHVFSNLKAAETPAHRLAQAAAIGKAVRGGRKLIFKSGAEVRAIEVDLLRQSERLGRELTDGLEQSVTDPAGNRPGMRELVAQAAETLLRLLLNVVQVNIADAASAKKRQSRGKHLRPGKFSVESGQGAGAQRGEVELAIHDARINLTDIALMTKLAGVGEIVTFSSFGLQMPV